MQFSFLSVLFLFGALQGILFMAGMWRKRTQHSLTLRLLMLLLISISVILSHHGILMSLSGKEAWHYSLMGVSAACWLAVPPALYLYVLSLTEEGFRWRPGYLGYFVFSIYHIVNWLLGLFGFSYLLVAVVFGVGTLRLLKPAPQLARLRWMRHYVIAFLIAIGISTVALLYIGLPTGYMVLLRLLLPG